MVVFERPCLSCGVICEGDALACRACGASLKTTLPLNENVDALSTLRLTHHLQANSLFKERYQIVRRVGVGGFGAVYEAEDTQEKRQVAIKEIGLSGLTSQQMIEATGSFNREIQMLSSLQHHSIPAMYAQLTDTEHWYLVMDFIAGETLEESLAQADGGSLPLEECLRIGVQLCEVLEYLHSRQPVVIFRDLKPSNIILAPGGQLSLVDFGVARQYKPGKPKDTIAFGSPGYAAPEQYGRAQTTPRSDIYSLGVLLHQMLTGQDPSLNHFRFLPLSIYDPGIPDELETLIAQMLEADMESRPESAAEVRQQLQAFITLHNVAGQRKTVARPGSSAPVVAVTAPASAFSTIGVTVYIYRGHAAPIHALAWSPDGSSIVSCDSRRFISLWNAFRPSPARTLPATGAGLVNDLAWSPDGSVLATAGEDCTVRLWRLDAHPHWWQMVAFSLGFRSSLYNATKGPVHALAWSPDGQMLVSAERSALHIWDAQTKELLLVCKGHTGPIEDVAWSPDGQWIASCCIDHSTRIWSVVDGKSLWHWHTKGSIVHALAWSPDGRYLACGASNGTVRVWDTSQKCQVYIYQAHKDEVSSVAWSPDGQRIASASFDKTVHLWRALDGKERFIYRSHEASVLTVAWSPDGQHLASAGKDAVVHIWKTM